MTQKQWEKFEKIIERIQTQTAPNATVTHNEKIMGKSGRKRQIDVSLRQKVGLFEVLIVIECKRYRRPVTIDKVEAFVQKNHDVGASYGVMISNSGFDAGAKAIADSNYITLLTYSEAQQADWSSIVGADSWIKAYLSNITDEKYQLITKGQETFDVTFDTRLFDSNGHAKTDIENYTYELKKITFSDERIGSFELEVGLNDEIYFLENGNLKAIDVIKIAGVKRTFEFIINASLEVGHLLKDELANKHIFKEVTSNAFDWEEVLKQPSREVSPEEYENIIAQNKVVKIPDFDKKKRYWKVVFRS